MTIRSFAPGALASNRAADMFVSMRRELDDMKRQLATGKRPRPSAASAVEARSSLDRARQDGPDLGLSDGDRRRHLRLNRCRRWRAPRHDGARHALRSPRVRASMSSATGRGRRKPLPTAPARGARPSQTGTINGRHLFAGRSPEAPPVETYDVIMRRCHPSGPLDPHRGSHTTRSRRRRPRPPEDQVGPSRSGDRANVRLTGNGVGPTFPFGFELVSATSSSAVITAATRTGTPEQIDLAVDGVPLKDDTVTIVLRAKDNTTYSIQLTARDTVNPGDRGLFQIAPTRRPRPPT